MKTFHAQVCEPLEVVEADDNSASAGLFSQVATWKDTYSGGRKDDCAPPTDTRRVFWD